MNKLLNAIRTWLQSDSISAKLSGKEPIKPVSKAKTEVSAPKLANAKTKAVKTRKTKTIKYLVPAETLTFIRKNITNAAIWTKTLGDVPTIDDIHNMLVRVLSGGIVSAIYFFADDKDFDCRFMITDWDDESCAENLIDSCIPVIKIDYKTAKRNLNKVKFYEKLHNKLNEVYSTTRFEFWRRRIMMDEWP